MVGKQVYVTLYSIHSDPSAGHVQHHASVREARGVVDPRAGDFDGQRARLGVDLGRQQPQQRLDAVEDAAVVASRDLDPLRFHGQRVGLAAERRVCREHDRVVGRHTVAGLSDVDIFAQVAGQRRERRLVAELCAGRYAVCAGKGRLARRKRLRMGVEEATKGAQDGREVA